MTREEESTHFVQIAGIGRIIKDAVKLVLRLGNHRGQYFLLIVFEDGAALSIPDNPDILKQLQLNFSFKDCTTRELKLAGLESVTAGPYRTKFLVDVSLIPGNQYTLAIQENHERDMVPAMLKNPSRQVEQEQLIPHYRVTVGDSTDMVDVNRLKSTNKPSKFIIPSP